MSHTLSPDPEPAPTSTAAPTASAVFAGAGAGAAARAATRTAGARQPHHSYPYFHLSHTIHRAPIRARALASGAGVGARSIGGDS